MQAKPELGKSIVYTPNYVERIRGAIENPAGELAPEKSRAEKAQYLKVVEQPPEGYVPLAEVREELGLGVARLRTLIANHGDKIGEIKVFKPKGMGGPARFLSPAQMKIVREISDDQKNSAPPAGYLTASAFATAKNVQASSMKELIEKSASELGEIEEYFLESKNQRLPFLSPAQQRILASKLVMLPPEDYMSQAELWKKLGLAQSSFQLVMNKCRDQLGEVKRFASSRKRVTFGSTEYFSPEQQQIIIETYMRRAEVESMPDGYVNLKELLSKFGVSERLANKLIKRHSASMGEIKEYRLLGQNGRPGKVVSGFSPEQQRIFGEVLARQRAETEAGHRDFGNHRTVPEGYKNLSELSEYLGVSRPTIRGYIKKLGEEVGEPEEYKNIVGTKYKYYSPEQIVKIERAIKSSKRYKGAGT